MNIVLFSWLVVRLYFLSALMILIMGIFATNKREEINSGTAGLVLSSALSTIYIIGYLIQKYTDIELHMVSFERIDEYSKLPEEAPWNCDADKSTLNNWPNRGEIQFENYEMKYPKNDELVLKGINITIQSRQKVGIVGRTGAGKSTLILGLFRTVKPCNGRIIIDGIDISTLGLHELRSNLTIIPQDPVLFSGTLRMNLDPFDKYSDMQIWIALEQANLKSFVITLDSGLNFLLIEGGQNISLGQRQQICLARALLKKTTILVLDEATASMDLETDKLIQDVIRNEFKDCTVLTIAHRIQTVHDYDRIIVMNEGRIVEDGKPDDLLQDKDSLFCRLGNNA